MKNSLKLTFLFSLVVVGLILFSINRSQSVNEQVASGIQSSTRSIEVNKQSSVRREGTSYSDNDSEARAVNVDERDSVREVNPLLEKEIVDAVASVAKRGSNIAFSANPKFELQRGAGNFLIYPKAKRSARVYKKDVVFDGAFFGAVQSGINGDLTLTDLTKTAVEVSMDLSSVERFLKSDAEYLAMDVSASESLLIRIDEIVEQGEHTVLLSGNVKDEPLSEVHFVFHDGAVAGSIELIDSFTYYEIGMAGNGAVAIRTMDTTKDIYGSCETCLSGLEQDPENDITLADQVLEATPRITDVALSVTGANDDYSNVLDGVLGYSTAAMNAVGGQAAIEAKILLGIGFINQVLINSGIEDTYVALLGTIEEVDYTKSGHTAYGDLSNMESYDLYLLLGADFQAFIYNGGGGSSGVPSRGFVCGVNSMGSSSASFPHEFGHCVGCYHAWADTLNDSGHGTDRFGWRFKTPSGTKVRTLMSYNQNWAGPRLGYFSTPDNLYQTVRMGAEPGYDAREDATVDPQLYQGGAIGQVDILGYTGEHDRLGANNRDGVREYIAMIQHLSERTAASVIEPASQSILYHGETHTINWLGGDDTQTATIDLYKGGEFQQSIKTVKAHLRWQEWTIPVVDNDDDYTIRITFDGLDVIESGDFAINDASVVAIDLVFEALQDIPAVIELPSSPAVPLSYHYSEPAFGSLSGVAPNLVYTPDSYQPTDSFTYYTSYENDVSEVRTVTIETMPIIAHWPLDDTFGDVISDLSANGYHGTRFGATPTDGIIGGAMNFKRIVDDEAPTYVKLPAEAFNDTDEISISMWVYVDEDEFRYLNILRGKNALNVATFGISRIAIEDESIIWRMSGDTMYSPARSLSNPVIIDHRKKWTHYVFTKNETTSSMRVYINGELETEELDNNGVIAGLTEVFLGSSAFPGFETYLGNLDYEGNIDEVRVYDQAMTDEQVAMLYSLDIDQYITVPESAGDSDYHVTSEEAVAFRSTGTPKSMDADGDDVYGTAGYYFYGNGVNANSNSDGTPSWVTEVGMSGVTLVAQEGYDDFDNPTLAISDSVEDWTITTIGLVNTEGTTGGLWAELMTFTVDETAPRAFRLGVMAGNEVNANGRWDPAALRLSLDDGLSVVANVLSEELGMVFFDVRLDDDVSGTFSIEGQTRSLGSVTRGPSIAGITFDELNTVLTGYEKWLVDNDGLTDEAVMGDPDNDGIVNILEYALNGDPYKSDPEILPRASEVVDGCLFSFRRSIAALEDTTMVFQYSSSVLDEEWTDVEMSDAKVTLGEESNGTQSVDIMISDADAVGKKLFGRIKVTYQN